jgi:biotin carboxyl carrier protein
MKMENEVHAHRGGVVHELSVAPGDAIAGGQVVCVLDDQ